MSDPSPRKPATAVISARMPAELVDRIYQTARSKNQTASDFVHEAVMRAMSSKDVKDGNGRL